MNPFLSSSKETRILSFSISVMIPVITFPKKLSVLEESLLNCLMPNETLSLSKSISKILNLTRSFNL